MSVELDKNIQKSFLQMLLNQSSAVSITTQSETFCKNLFQNESRNETICESLFQNASNQLSIKKNDAVLITEFIFTQLNTMNSQVLMNCSQQ